MKTNTGKKINIINNEEENNSPIIDDENQNNNHNDKHNNILRDDEENNKYKLINDIIAIDKNKFKEIKEKEKNKDREII